MTKTPYIPHSLPIEDLNWQRLVPYISQATRVLARYDGLLQNMINPAILLSPITTQEAVLSSRIEGTQATFGEVLQHEAGEEFDKEKTNDIREISNYRQALRVAEKSLKERPITLSLVKELHAILMDSVRGKDKLPGQFRIDQNWIGKQGTPIEQARFIPPSPLIMQEHLDAWQSFMCSDYDDPLVQMAIVHAQFEIIHPFKDGNGRLGRMLVPLFLYQKGALGRPMFYLSEYLETHKDAYNDGLLMITEKNNWQGWIEFFLRAILAQAEQNMRKAQSILELHKKLKDQFQQATQSKHSWKALDTFFRVPIINAARFQELAEINNRGTANQVLRKLVSANLIQEIRPGSGQRPAVFALPELMNITEGKPLIIKA
jgi:Fic family protein